MPVPLGVVGEICIGGEGVGRGYLNRPELTAERFLEDPFSREPHARMYKTGDLGRWLSDGKIEYLGRNDQQVKIRGFRIELGEIEAQLKRYPGVAEAVVLARAEPAEERRLVAYVNFTPEMFSENAIPSVPLPDVETLRAHLRAVLPEHMVPVAFVVLDAMPLTPGGKLDRSALPAPDLAAFTSHVQEPPQGDVEEAVADIWQTLLRVKRIGRQDNFFELGGHSLLATRMIGRVREKLCVQATPRALFEAPTLSAFAKTLETMLWLRRSSEKERAANNNVYGEEGVL
jgi:hypothetical protein